jgi:BirA family biotin operon repressor/biotin-[acetyl-CoA-carboxylase] ligase
MEDRVENRISVIRTLANGNWHSGEALARSLGISRAAVWKRLQRLAEWGLEVQAVHGRGYRLAQALDLLDAAKLIDALSENSRQALEAVHVEPVLDSTSSFILNQPVERARLCLAEYQTAGRGRRGRRWFSPFGANLYLSLGWRFDGTPAGIGALSLAVGVGIAESLAQLGVKDVALKWPNDLVWKGRKLGGILVEHRGESGGPALVAVGVGLNLRMSAQQGAGIAQDWTDLASVLEAQSLDMPGRNRLAAAIVDALVRVLQQFATEGFPAFARRWSKFDACRDREVVIEQDNGSQQGRARGIDADGALLLEANGQTKRFLSGDVSLRLPA